MMRAAFLSPAPCRACLSPAASVALCSLRHLSRPVSLPLRLRSSYTATGPSLSPPHSSLPPSSSPSSSSSSSPSPSPPPPPRTRALVLLNLVTVLWGTQHAVIKLAVDSAHLSPASLNFARFLLAALVSAPFLPSPRASRTIWARGLEQAAWMFAGYACQAVALQSTSASRSGFLLYLNVKLVPLFARLLYGRRIAVPVWLSAALALAGTALLTYDGSPPVAGDAWSVAAAAASAMFILRMERAAATARPAAANAVALVGVAAMSGAWACAAGAASAVGDGVAVGEVARVVVTGLVPKGREAVGAVLYLGLVATALSNYLQTVGQQNVSAERAAVVFAMDPVYGAGFAYLLLGERLGGQGVLGAALVTLAALWSSQVGDKGGERKEGGGERERSEERVQDKFAPGEDFGLDKRRREARVGVEAEIRDEEMKR